MSDLFLDALSVKAPVRSLPDLIKDTEADRRREAAVQRADATPRPPYRAPAETHQRPAPQPGNRHPWADQIDQMVADMVSRGDVYLDGDSYTCRKRSWRMVP